jgi:ABC-type transport system involved in multi-copper enzyme maturation permease subunit
MLTVIIRREFLSNILTFRFAIGLIIYLALMVVCTYISTEDYKERLEGYNSAAQQHREMLDKEVQVYSDLVNTWDIGGIKVDVRPTPLSIFNQGIIDKVNNTLNFGFALAPNIDTGQRQSNTNPLMKAFSSIDITLVLQIVMSLLAILFAYDSISGERENGTLALTMSNSISRGTLLLGKYIGGMLTLFAIFLPSFLVSLMMIYFSPNISLSGDEWLKIGMFFLTSIAYTSAFFLIGMFISAMTESSATTLMIALLAWTFAVILYPNIVVFAVDQIMTESVSGLNIEPWEYWNEYEAEKDKYLDSLGLKREGFWRITEGLNSSGSGFGGSYTRLRNVSPVFSSVPLESAVSAVCERFGYLEPLRVRYADRLWREVDSKIFQRKVIREKLATSLLRVSPAGAYYNSTAIISGTDSGSYENFFKQVQQYRQEVLQYAYDKKLFSSPGWFIVERKESLSDFPVFKHRFETAKESFRRMAVDIIILIAFNAIFFMASYISFLRSELR